MGDIMIGPPSTETQLDLRLSRVDDSFYDHAPAGETDNIRLQKTHAATQFFGMDALLAGRSLS